MVAPETYRDMFKNSTLEECIEARDEIYELLKRVENDDYPEEEKRTTVCPVFQYGWYLETFIKINDLVRDKFYEQGEDEDLD